MAFRLEIGVGGGVLNFAMDANYNAMRPHQG